MGVLLWPLIWFITGILAAVVAKSKGRSFIVWFIVGFLFGPLALLAAVGVSDIRQALVGQQPQPTPQKTPSGITDPEGARLFNLQRKFDTWKNEPKTCPHCAEDIKRLAKVCKHCGRDLTPDTIPEDFSELITPKQSVIDSPEQNTLTGDEFENDMERARKEWEGR